MAFTPAQGTEPIPGYKLIEKLGSGGFGEVWKATAPGELTKAIKIVFGNLEDQRAEQELKALRRIKQVRHPFLLSLERIEVQDGQLIIVTELADKSLMERFLECRKAGLAGIARAELLGYLRDAADALDYMQSTADLQHLDVKPQNLLLVAGRIKVADFGLVKDLAVSSISAAGGATPVYASPEAFDSKVSRASDQYSLAIVYQEMLTGVRPFQGESTLQLAMQHVHGRPVLKPLPPQDRPIIGRALSKVPQERYATCREMVDALHAAKEVPYPAAETPVASVESTPSFPSLKFPQPVPALIPISPPPSLRPLPADLMPASIEHLSILVSTVIRQGAQASPKPLEDLKRDTIAAQGGPKAETVRPTLYVGLGGLAGTVLRRLKRRFVQRFGDPTRMAFFPMLLVDVDRVALRRSMKGDPREALMPAETLLTPLYAPEHYRHKARELLRWLDRRWLYGIPRSLRTEGLRPLGRLALVDNASAVLARLRAALAALTSPETRTAAQARGIVFREEAPRIVLVASVSGGTGGGMIADMAYAVRQVLADLDVTAEAVCGILLHTAGKKPADREMAQINVLATLSELSHYSESASVYPGDADHGLRPCGPGQRPFEDCYLVPLGDQVDRSEAEAAAENVAEYLALDASGHVGPTLDQFRRQTRQMDSLALRVFGLQRLGTTREYLGERAAAALCRQVVALWTGGLSVAESESIDTQAERLATSLALDAPALLKRFEAAAIAFSGGDPLARLQPALVRSLEELQLSSEGTMNLGVTKHVLARLEEYFGVAAAADDKSAAGRASLLDALRVQGHELVSNACQSIAQWLRFLVDSPGDRLASADRAADWFARYVEEQVRTVTGRQQSVRAQREQLKSRFFEDTPGTTRKLGALFGRGRRRETTDTALNPLSNYCQLRLEEFLLDHAYALLAEMGHIIAHMHQELAGCRFEVKALGSAIAAASKGPPLEELTVLPGVTWLVPGNMPSLLDAEQALLVSMAGNYARHVDRLVQQEILDGYGGLWAVASGAFGPQSGRGSLIELLQKAIAARARKAASVLLENYDAATLLLDSLGGEEAAWEAVTAQIRAAQPAAATPDRPRMLLMAIPPTAGGDKLRDRALRTFMEGGVTVVASAGDILVCQEAAGVPPREALAGLTDADVAWAPLAARISTRTDVAWSGLSCPAP